MSILDAPSYTRPQADAKFTIASPASINATTHASTLSSAESSASVLVFTGALTVNVTFQLSTDSRRQLIENATTGNFSLSVKRGSSGVSYPIPQGETVEVR